MAASNTTSIPIFTQGPAINKTSELCFVNDSYVSTTGKISSYVIVFIISFFANILVSHAAFKDTNVRRTVNRLVANICIANLLITVVYMPRMMVMIKRGSVWLVGGATGLALCKIVPIIHHACILVSILSLATLSVDRFFNIVLPMKQIFTPRRVNFIILFMWMLAVCVRIPMLIALELLDNPKRALPTCGARYSKTFQSDIARNLYFTSLLIAFYALPLITMVILYAIVIIYLRKKERFQTQVDNSVEAKYREARKSVLTMLLIVSFTFIICWITYFVAQVVFNPVPCTLRFWRFFLAHLNCAISPCLFLVFSRGYRDVVGNTLYYFCCVCCTSCEIAEMESTVVDEGDDSASNVHRSEHEAPPLQLLSVSSVEPKPRPLA